MDDPLIVTFTSSGTSWPGPSEPHVIPTQGQPTPPESEIDLEALMELSTEEQKTHLEVEYGPGVVGWKLSLEWEEPRNLVLPP